MGTNIPEFFPLKLVVGFLSEHCSSDLVVKVSVCSFSTYTITVNMGGQAVPSRMITSLEN